MDALGGRVLGINEYNKKNIGSARHGVDDDDDDDASSGHSN